MSKESFEIKYKDKGGLIKLREMMNDNETLSDIGRHFGVTRDRVRQWVHEYFQIKYDPRYARRQIVVDFIRETVMKYGEKDALKKLRGMNKTYIKEALKQTNGI